MVQHKTEQIEQSKLLQGMVIDVMRKHRCTKVRDLVDKLQQLDRSITFEEIRDVMNEMKHDGVITLSEPRVECSFSSYMKSISKSAPLWLTVFVSIATLSTVYLIPQEEPWLIARIITGAVFVLFMPGYALVQILFPLKDMEVVERIVLSIGLSFAVSPIIGLMLNYILWGIRLDSIVLSLSAISIALAFGAIYKKFKIKRRLAIL